MTDTKPTSQLQDQTAFRWGRLEDEREACVVVSDRMELVYINAAARALVPGEWFGKRCFEVLPTVDEACAFHCPTIAAVTESVDVAYCEETLSGDNNLRRVFGVGLIPLGKGGDDRARAIFLLRAKGASVDEGAFRVQLLTDARSLARRMAVRLN